MNVPCQTMSYPIQQEQRKIYFQNGCRGGYRLGPTTAKYPSRDIVYNTKQVMYIEYNPVYTQTDQCQLSFQCAIYFR